MSASDAVPDPVVDASAEEGARVVALALLARADEASERYRGQVDEEALHDFRVALRRLRSTLRAFRPWLEDGVGRKLEQRIAKLARATNAARDAEVQLAWLEPRLAELPRVQRSGAEALVAELEGRMAGPAPERLVKRYQKVSAKLAPRLGTYLRRVPVAGASASPSFGAVLAGALRQGLAELRAHLGEVQGSDDETPLHTARISGKRLRYVLEPLAGNPLADAGPAVKRLKKLQDVLGELHDAHVLAAELGQAYVAAAGRRASAVFEAVAHHGAEGAALRSAGARGPRGGLLALARANRERREERFAELRRTWLPEGLATLAAQVEELAGALEARAAPPAAPGEADEPEGADEGPGTGEPGPEVH
ncbi:MAG: CHAD domain-containing protein [Anaeromyxobacter sp.]